MRIPHAAMPAIRLVVILLFAAMCAVMFGFLWVNSGGRLPLISKEGYQASLRMPKVANLVNDADVMVAGVKAGKVAEMRADGDQAYIRMRLNSENAPLHQGATVQVRNKTMVEETFLEIHDGSGPEIPPDSELPPGTGKPAVQLNDVLASLDPETRNKLGGGIRSLGAVTQDGKRPISDTLAGLGELGRKGGDAVSALASQSDDLKKLTGNTAQLMSALDTRQGQIAQLVDDANRVTEATANGRGDIETVMRQLPGLLTTAGRASDGLNKLSTDLAPVASSLRAAAPQLSSALQQLPATSADLRRLLPSLNGTLDKAPPTLDRTPMVARDTSAIAPNANVALSDVNPMLSYLQPYGRDIAAFFTNVGNTLSRGDANGNELRVFAVLNEQSVRGLPIDLNRIAPLNKRNPYPAPGQSANPGPYNGTYPRVERR